MASRCSSFVSADLQYDSIDPIAGLEKKKSDRCSIEEFAVYFLNFIRNQTEEFTKGPSSKCDTPKKVFEITDRTHQNVTSSTEPKNVSRSLFTPSNENKLEPITPIKFNDVSIKSSIDFEKSIELRSTDIQPKNDFPSLCSTPIRHISTNSKHSSAGSNTNHSRSMGSVNNTTFSPQLYSGGKSQQQQFSSLQIRSSRNSSTASSSLCLSDFITPTSSKSHKRKTPKSQSQHQHSDNNNSMMSEQEFPSLSSRSKIASRTNDLNDICSSPSITQKPITILKPKKRVAPITVASHSNHRHEFGSPAFRSDNNLLNIHLIDDHNDDTFDSRKLLKTHIDAISKDFENEPLPERGIHAIIQEKHQKLSLNDHKSHQSQLIDLTKIDHKFVLDKLINIHSAIIDMNLMTNVLTEIAYLLNLLNVDVNVFGIRDGDSSDVAGNQLDHQSNEISSSMNCRSDIIVNVADNLLPDNILRQNINNCVYYSLGVLNKQKHILALLDITTIKVLLDNERLSEFNENIKEFLFEAYSHKLKLESLKRNHDISFKPSTMSLSFGGRCGGGVDGGGSRERGGDESNNNRIGIVDAGGGGNNINVFYQQENDTKDNFPSIREFMAFRKQRDCFCNILRIWEEKHYNPTWIFETEVGSKVRSLINLSDHPINMSHLAKLFTSQLILSCSQDDTSSELQQALPKVDLSKLSKLQQRLNAPSSSGTDYLFPGHQQFFKEFILSAQNYCTFMEQLKIVLVVELMELNGSTYETLHLSVSESADDIDDRQTFHEYVVRPQIILILRVLAKFLGLVIARPYAYEGPRNSIVDGRQIEMRNLLPPDFDIKSILTKSIADQKLIVTIPWLVQFIAMLDYITLRLNYFIEVLSMLYELYIITTDSTCLTIKMRPTSAFIVRTCLGWLFDQSNVPDEYYKYRQNRKPLQAIKKLDDSHPTSQFIPMPILVGTDAVKHFTDTNFMLADIEESTNGTLKCLLKNVNKDELPLNQTTNDVTSLLLPTMDPMLEQILHAACPFLSDFRVSIMSTKHSKTVSRTGRFRHITTKLASEPTPKKTQREIDNATKLIDGFLHSQSLSVRRTVEFVIERTVSAVIKDFQIEIMLPTKRQTLDDIGKRLVDAMTKELVVREMNDCYNRARIMLIEKWNDVVPKNIWTRVKKAFDALLPNETLPAVKATCISISAQKCESKTLEWRTSNLSDINFFSKDVLADAQKFLQNRQIDKAENANAFVIDLTKFTPTDALGQLQIVLHKCSMKPNELNESIIIQLLANLTDSICGNNLQPYMYRTIAFMILQLINQLICNRSDMITMNLLKHLTEFWQCPKLIEFTRPPLLSNDNDDDIDTGPSSTTDLNVSSINDQNKKSTYIFEQTISSCYLLQLMLSSSCAFDAFEKLLIHLIANNFLTINILNTQCVALLRDEWPPEILGKLSTILRNVIDATNQLVNDVDSNGLLFLEMISDLSRDIDDLQF